MAGTLPSPIVLYTRPGCHLCDDARQMLEGLLRDRTARGPHAISIEERDISTDLALERELFGRIPVVEVGGQRLELVTSLSQLRRFLTAALGPLEAGASS